MRLNRGTLMILALAIVVIIAAAVILNTQEEAPINEAASIEVVNIPVFEAVNVETVNRLVVLQNGDGALTVMDREGDEWVITQATNSTEREVDQETAQARIHEVLALAASDSFAGELLDDFGLTTPQYIISLADDERVQTLYIGGQNPGGTRYYALLSEDTPVLPEPITADDEADGPAYEPVTLSGGQPIYLVAQTVVNSLTGMIANPPYVPAPTPTPLPSATLNPLSEVQQATATHEAYATETQIFLEIEAGPDVTPEAEATAEAD